jgi:hypothetical protein
MDVPMSTEGYRFLKLDLAHVLIWPPQPTTLAGIALVTLAFMQPEIALPAVIAGLVAIVGDDGSRRKKDG